MATVILILIAILVVCNWNWFEDRVKDIEAIGGVIFTVALIAFWTWALHGVAAWVGFFDSWLLSFAIVCIYAVGRYKYAG